ncbi:MAG: DNA translocase FtsK [Clostridia bacterium]|nr:DNA translocase FtsK [Lachnospiraceae bacterium]NCB99064.1 DNA translocase FtsK [Clostridia bacterium]NCD03502.1 DNA translocase FtsK [Clostridia bacterium]
MAGKQQKTTSGRKAPAKKKTVSGNSRRKTPALTKEEKAKQAGIRDEVVVLTILALSILLVLSNFNLCGRLGQAISNVTFGLFGFMAYFFPLVFFFGVSFFIANRSNRVAKIKLGASIFCYLFLAIFVHMVSEPYDKAITALQAYRDSAAGHSGGGLIGSGVVHILHPLLGTVGCYVVIIVLILISVVLMTQKSIFIPLSKKGKTAYVKASEHHKEQKELRRKEKEVQKVARGAGGNRTVSFNEIREKFEKKDLNFDLAQQPEEAVPEVKPVTEKPVKKNRSEAKKPAVDEITEEIILPLQDLDAIPVNHMEPIQPIEVAEPSSSAKKPSFVMPKGDMKPIQIEDEPDFLEDEPVVGADLEVSPEAREKAAAKAAASKVDGPSEAEKQATAEDIEAALEQKPEYVFPPMDLLVPAKPSGAGNSDEHLRQTALKLKSTLESFGVKVQVTNVSCGPSVTRYELQPEQGVKVSKILSLSDDIKLNLAVADIRIEAPIPGKAAIGIEVPNKENTTVTLRELLESKEFRESHSDIAFAAGRDISGKVILADIAKMPHLLIAGATGSGKSVCINTLIMSIIYKATPEDVRLIMVDPKVVELSVYNGIPHLLIPVVTDPKKAAGALNWAVMEMTDRYKKFAELNVRDVKGYNEKVEQAEFASPDYPKLPQIVIIVDELADLMMVAPGEVEDAICRLAQLARACGIHLVIATQRPSVNVITGLIKANIPSRIAFSVSSGVDSRTIIDMIGAEKLLGKGDMLFYPSGYQKPLRVQGAFVSDKEVNDVVAFLKESQNDQVHYNEDITSKITSAGPADSGAGAEHDVYFVDAGKFIIDKDKASIGMLQRVFKIGFNRAARIMDQLYEAGVVGPEEGTKPRKVLMSPEEFENYVEESV